MRASYEQAQFIQRLLLNDHLRRSALALVANCVEPTAMIVAGFVRDAVWDDLHDFGVCPPVGDIDVVFHNPNVVDSEPDRVIECWLRKRMPELEWSVKSQARMHRRNGDAPYGSVRDAMRHWPETATATAVALSPDEIRIEAPFGLGDLMALIVRPAPGFLTTRRHIFEERVAAKRWLERYPRLRMAG